MSLIPVQPGGFYGKRAAESDDVDTYLGDVVVLAKRLEVRVELIDTVLVGHMGHLLHALLKLGFQVRWMHD